MRVTASTFSDDSIQRHRTAKVRTTFSLSVKSSLHQLHKTDTILDYGCGRGDDVRLLRCLGYNAVGYDPYWQPNYDILDQYDVVFCNYVINVIENPAEREEVLAECWDLCSRLLIVAAQVGNNKHFNHKAKAKVGDGYITRWDTFFKYYGYAELGDLVDITLNLPWNHTKLLTQGVLCIPKIPSTPRLLHHLTRHELIAYLEELEALLDLESNRVQPWHRRSDRKQPKNPRVAILNRRIDRVCKLLDLRGSH